FVVFIIGARINSELHAFRGLVDLGGRRGMNHMLKYLTEHPGKGCSATRRRASPSFSTGDPSSTWRHSPRTLTIHTSRCGVTTGERRQERTRRYLARDLPRACG